VILYTAVCVYAESYSPILLNMQDAKNLYSSRVALVNCFLLLSLQESKTSNSNSYYVPSFKHSWLYQHNRLFQKSLFRRNKIHLKTFKTNVSQQLFEMSAILFDTYLSTLSYWINNGGAVLSLVCDSLTQHVTRCLRQRNSGSHCWNATKRNRSIHK
jgi:hypothetical protein